MSKTTQAKTYRETRTLYIAMELGSKTWNVASASGGRKVRSVSLDAKNFEGLEKELASARGKFDLPEDCRVVICQEAGRDGFWIHRELVRRGYESLVIEPASLKVNRRQRRAKTDRLDAKALTRELVRYDQGDVDTWSVVRVPTPEDEDTRRPERELTRLTKERSQHTTRVKAVLNLVGAEVDTMARLERDLDGVRTATGEKLPQELKEEVRRELARWRLVHNQVLELEGKRRSELREGATRASKLAKKLQRLVGIGERSSWAFATELFSWREFRNRRELAGYLGIDGTPYDSGLSSRDQGISKAGPRRLRGLLVEVAWGWLKFQPSSELSQWFHRKWDGAKRSRKAGIVALARRLLIALWHWVEHDAVPKGALVRPA